MRDACLSWAGPTVRPPSTLPPKIHPWQECQVGWGVFGGLVRKRTRSLGMRLRAGRLCLAPAKPLPALSAPSMSQLHCSRVQGISLSRTSVQQLQCAARRCLLCLMCARA